MLHFPANLMAIPLFSHPGNHNPSNSVKVQGIIMFGSKLRSWMETHIVRPRKKGNKHKQVTAEAGGSGSSAGKKSGTLPPPGSNVTSPVLTSSGSHSIASPVRRREVSPIQCHVCVAITHIEISLLIVYYVYSPRVGGMAGTPLTRTLMLSHRPSRTTSCTPQTATGLFRISRHSISTT